ncbi:MAG TPA: extracellular solute-binding protein [Chloroflexota bacterium]|nr:extracellular solute-binding protein [Chloroflexota bacterium]
MHRKLVAIAVAFVLAGCGGPGVQPAGKAAGSGVPNGPTDVARYQGADRQQVLEAGARKEGTVSWYTAIAGDVISALTNGFQQKYPYLKLNVFRSDELQVMQHITQETQAGTASFDVTDLNGGATEILVESKLITPYYSPSLANISASLKMGRSGPLVDRASDWATIIGFGHNTTLIPKDAVPKTTVDLMNPALAGKLALAGTTTGYYWVGSVLAGMGDAAGKQWLADFAGKQKPAVQQISAKALLDLIAKGEVPASLTVYRDHVRQAQTTKAPVAWIPLEPDVSLVNYVVVGVNAPHPNAAMLFVDYLLGEGQQVLKDNFYTTGSEKLPFKTWIPYKDKTTAQYDEATKSWSDLFKADFR